MKEIKIDKNYILSIVASLCLCDHMGDVIDDIGKMLEDIGYGNIMENDFDCSSELLQYLPKGTKTLWDSDIDN
jgi:hypothetical protein